MIKVTISGIHINWKVYCLVMLASFFMLICTCSMVIQYLINDYYLHHSVLYLVTGLAISLFMPILGLVSWCLILKSSSFTTPDNWQA